MSLNSPSNNIYYSLAVQTPVRLLSGLIAPLSFAAVSSTLLRSNNWSAWGVEALPATTPSAVSFGDLANITATADCLAANLPIQTCDPYGRPFQPYVELPAQMLNFFNLGINDTGSLGVALAVIFFLAIAITTISVAFAWTGKLISLFAAQALIALIAISPGSMLAVERGQIEQLTLALVVFALITLSGEIIRRAHLLPYLGSIASVVATATKYLSIGMFLPFIHRGLFSRSKIRQHLPILIGGALSALFVLISLPNVLQATETSGASNPQTTKSAFSVTTLLATAFSGENNSYFPTTEVVDNWSTLRLASYALFILITAIWILALRKQAGNRHNRSRTNLAWVLTLGSGGVLLFPYLLGNSHDYRLIFLIPLAAGAALLSQARPAVGTILAISAGLTATTSAAMVPLPNGFMWPTSILVLGDAALMLALSGIMALWVTTAFKRDPVET